ncbi:MAG: endo-1,4-beta-xylanase [Planctomycetota bacterium]|nr:endo-1,4-beta-xylanase [Planctomycetota bacterium]
MMNFNTSRHRSGQRTWARATAVVLLLLPAGAWAAEPTSKPGALPKARPLREVYKDDFLVGVAVGPYVYQGSDKTIGPLVGRQFSALTPENATKWQPLNPTPGVYKFDEADKLVRFAQANRMQVIGHTLVWHSQTPDWVFKGPDGKDASRELLLQRMRQHIEKVVGHYRGAVKGWDVVNEAVADGGKQLRQTPWRRIIGDDFIEKAFEYAHKADPKAQLYYNEYGLEDPAKRLETIKLVKGLKEKGIPIHAVGNQAHWQIDTPPIEQIEKTIEDFAALGVKVNFTELDMNLYAWGDNADRYKDSLPEELLQKQAARYAAMFELFRKHKGTIERVTFWGPTDRYTWLNSFPVKRTNYPLLFDRDNKPKLAYWAVLDPSAYLADPARKALVNAPAAGK